MYYDLTEFLDSLKGITREAASQLIQEELDLLSQYHQRVKSREGIKHKTFTREYNFLKILLNEIKSPGKSQVKNYDREVIYEVLQSLKTSSPIKIIKAKEHR